MVSQHSDMPADLIPEAIADEHPNGKRLASLNLVNATRRCYRNDFAAQQTSRNRGWQTTADFLLGGWGGHVRNAIHGHRHRRPGDLPARQSQHAA